MIQIHTIIHDMLIETPSCFDLLRSAFGVLSYPGPGGKGSISVHISPKRLCGCKIGTDMLLGGIAMATKFSQLEYLYTRPSGKQTCRTYPCLITRG